MAVGPWRRSGSPRGTFGPEPPQPPMPSANASASATAHAAPQSRRGILLAVAAVGGAPAQRARHHEADARPLLVDRTGLVVDQPTQLAARDELHLIDVRLVPALPRDHPDVAGVAQPRAVAREQLVALLDRLHEHDHAVELAGFDEPAPDRLADLTPQRRAHVA